MYHPLNLLLWMVQGYVRGFNVRTGCYSVQSFGDGGDIGQFEMQPVSATLIMPCWLLSRFYLPGTSPADEN